MQGYKAYSEKLFTSFQLSSRAGKFMLGAAAAYNLKKWMNYQGKKVKTGAMQKVMEELSALKTHLTQQFFMSYVLSNFSTVKM